MHNYDSICRDEDAPVGYATLDPSGHILGINRVGCEILGHGKAYLVGRRITSVVANGARDVLRSHLRRCQETEGTVKSVVELTSKDGERSVLYFVTAPSRESGARLLRTAMTDVTELKDAELAALDAGRVERERAAEARAARDEFLSTVSHELRTPLQSMLGWAQLLRAKRVPPERQDRALAAIERNATAQAVLIEELLDVARIASGKVDLDHAPVDLASEVNAAIAACHTMAQSKGVRLDVFVDSTAIVEGDASRLRQIASNVIRNALKFTNKGGWVRVTLEEQGANVLLTVADSGAGIAADVLPIIFDGFRPTPGTEGSRPGLGLGLTITRHLVELHGGSVVAASEGEGRGAVFRVSLPRVCTGESVRPLSAKALPNEGALENAVLLVVDDEADTRDTIVAMLEASGAVVTAASSAEEAMALLGLMRPHAIVSDLGMPVEDGCSLIRRMRALPDHARAATPAIVVTAFSDEAHRSRAMTAGFDAYLTKPVDPQELVATVARLTGS